MWRRRGSIRLWQTELFMIVIVVAILTLTTSVSAGLKTALSDTAESAEARNASALAGRLEPELPVTVGSLDTVRDIIADHRRVYRSGIWVYDRDGTLLESAYDTAPAPAELTAARDGGLAQEQPYKTMQLQPNGWVIAAQVLHGPKGTREGVVVTASSVAESLDILDSVRNRIWVTFWVALGLAGMLGFAFSELISRRIRALSKAATAMADGHFEQRLTAGFFPDEIQDLALSYNRLGVRLGETFGELQESRREIAAVVDSMAEGLIAFDPDGAVRVINPEAVRLLRVPDRELTGVPAEEVTAEPAVLDVVRSGLAGATAARTVSLGHSVVLLHCTPLLDAGGRVGGAVLLLADVTEQHRIEDAQRRFVADASHEMRTPITALKGILELLADGAKDDSDVRDEFIHTMQVEADRLARLVTDLLTLAKLEARSSDLEVGPQPAAELLQEVARVMATLAEQAGVELCVETPDADVAVLAEHDKIVQVLLSFTDNALKNSPAGSKIRLRAHRRGDTVLLEVADEGRGIGPDQLGSVFERFYRGDTARAGGKGTGLGLAIAKEIVEAHGSTIEVDSAPGVGTTFRFQLPAA
jgi:signal transduction histidine kinase